MEEETKALKMSFEPKTIEHLGVKMYSHIPPALAELIANAYDACAGKVNIKLYDSGTKKIIVEDNGVGMTFDEINQYFLRIGRNRREEQQKSSCGRIPTGKKGLGKLALFGIGNTISISTKKNGNKVDFKLDWTEISEWTGGDYTPNFNESITDEDSGTTFILENLNRVTDFPLQSYAISIAKLFNFKASDFEVYISLNDGEPILIDNKLKYESIEPEFMWDFPETSEFVMTDFSYKSSISGKIISTEKPLKPGLRGITLFANGRMVNAQEFFGATESSHFFSYTTGWLDVDFIDNLNEDLISTDRQSINWETEITKELRVFLIAVLKYLEQDWRNKRKEKRKERVQENTNVNIDNWLKTVPPEIRQKLDVLIAKVDESELSTTAQSETIENLYALVPEYPNLHWRHLHSEIQSASSSDYKNQDYYRAFIEAVKRYINKVREKSASTVVSDSSMMGAVFGFDKVLKVAAMYNKPDGTRFHEDTYKCIEEGQKMLSMGIVSGARNPISHEEIIDLRESNLFNEKDCLDMLSLLSHLFRRLDDIVTI